MLAWMKSLPMALSLALWGGCAWKECLTCCDCCPRAAPQIACRPVDPQAVTPDLSQVPEHLPPVRPGEQFCALTEINVQCLAARNSTVANLLVQEAEAVTTQRKCFNDGSELASELLLLQATQQRNEDAAIALQLFLRLAEAEGGAQNVERRLHEVEAMQSDVEQLQNRGLAPPVSKNELAGERLELLHRQADVQGTIHRLNYQLAESMGVELAPGTRYWPEVDLVVDPQIPYSDEAVSVALRNRADLAALRLASQADGREAIAAARIILQPFGAGSSTSSSSGCLAKLLQACALRREADVRSEQLNSARRDHERTVENEVRQAIDATSTRLLQLSLTRDRQHVADARLKASQRQQEVGAAPLTVRKTRLDGLAVEQDLLHDVIEWKIAIVKLKEAQGLLASECGYCL